MKSLYVRSISAIAALTVLTGCSPVESPLPNEIGVDDPAIDAVFAEWDALDAPGCAIAIADKGELVYTRGYGAANLDYNIPITPETVFDVASITKQFAAASLTLLEEDGVLSLDDDVRRWLPELPDYGSVITLRHMIHHTSGLRDYLNLFPLAGRGSYYPISLDQILEMMARQRAPVFEPGERYEYSNTAYMLIAKVIERASGKSFGEFTDERIFKPLNMQSSFMYENLERIVARRATGYARNDAGEPFIVHNYNFDVAGDGQLYTTMPDLLRWDQWLHGESPSIYSQMLTDGQLNSGEPVNYAQGIGLEEYRGLRVVEHGGSSWGFRSHLLRFTGPGLSIALSCNEDSANPWRMAMQVADYLLADELGPRDEPDNSDDNQSDTEPQPVSLAVDELARLTGEYFSEELDATYRISLDGDQLLVRVEQEAPVVVTPLSDVRFEINFYDVGAYGPWRASLAFNLDEGGVVRGFDLSSGSETGLSFMLRR